MKISIIAALLLSFAFTSCTKTMDVVPQAPVTQTQSTAEIKLSEVKTSSDFNWATTKQIDFNFSGKDAESYNLLLSVKDEDGNVIMQKMQLSDQSFQTSLKIPANTSTLTVSYGADTKSIDCQSGSVRLSN